MTREEMLEANQVPHWDMLDSGEKKFLIQKILEMIVKWEPIPPQILEPLPVDLLKRLEFAVRKIRESGTAGGPESAPLRLKILRAALELRGQDASPVAKGPSENQVLNSQPRQVRDQVKANEALNLRQMQSQEALLLEKALRRR